jgi:HSP20 family protein
MIEDPFFSSPSVFPRYARSDPAWQPFAALQRQAAVEVSQDGTDVVVHAEVPGVQKENLDVHLSNDGQSLTIEGRVHRAISQAPSATPAAEHEAAAENGTSAATEGSTQGKLQDSEHAQSNCVTDCSVVDVVKSSDSSSALASTEGQSEIRSSFSRTLWLPEPVDGKRASAQLKDGILTLRIPKREHPAPERIAIN